MRSLSGSLADGELADTILISPHSPIPSVNVYVVCGADRHLGPNTRMLKVNPCYSFRLYTRAAVAWTKKKHSHRNEKLKAKRASETEEQRKERLRIRRENEKIENHEKQRLAALKI